MTDDYPGETTWELTNDGSGLVVGSGGPLGDPNTLYTSDVCVSSGECYTFTIFDSFGDGICCYYGNGFFNVLLDGELLGSGGEFAYSDSVADICTAACNDVPPGTPVDADGRPKGDLNLDCRLDGLDIEAFVQGYIAAG